ncbi:ph-response regulator protein palc [Stemphylium lycopersici]|nr:ph-response regulator protein palc [Stemphylium lycopersici]
MPTPESELFLAKKPKVAPTFDGVDYDDNTALKGAQDAIIREQWVKSMMARLVRDEMGKCYRREGVNHLEKCGHLRELRRRALQAIDEPSEDHGYTHDYMYGRRIIHYPTGTTTSTKTMQTSDFWRSTSILRRDATVFLTGESVHMRAGREDDVARIIGTKFTIAMSSVGVQLLSVAPNARPQYDEAKARSPNPATTAYLRQQLQTTAINTQQDAFSVRPTDNLEYILHRLLQQQHAPVSTKLRNNCTRRPSPCAQAAQACAGEEIDLVLVKELEVEWRSTLGSSIPGREPARVQLKSLESELCYTLSTLAYVYSLQARAQLHTLYNAIVPSPEQRATAIGAAMKHFLEANSIHTYLANRAGQYNSQPAAVDISAAVLGALAELTMAEATLITVLKDDPYPAIVIEDRNKQSKDWMFRGVEIPKVRAHLFARLCRASAEHAAKAQAMLGRSPKINDDLLKYVDDLRRTAKGKACRFLACDAEAGGKTGEGIAWLRGAKKELGFAALGVEEDKKPSGFSKLKKDWQEKREDRKIEKGVDWGTDAGKFEEGRIVGVQLIPPSEPLLASMPSGREYHTTKMFVVPALDEDALVRMRAPPDPSDAFEGNEDDSADEDERSAPAGAFPGTKADYAPSTSYY